MEEDTNWSLETHTLGDIVNFKFPCEIRMTEGFYDEESEEDTFSAGDIITIGDKQTIRKVSARFTKIVNEVSLATPDYDYVTLTGEDQILLPLNYKGLLKVLRHLRKFESVRELAEDFPRYAKICEGFKLRTEDNVTIPISEDTIIELLRIIKGSPGVSDVLVVRHKYRKEVKDSLLPFDMKKCFLAIKDDDDYTLEEAIKRYRLPLLVQFNNAGEIKKVYGHGKKITDTLRLEEKITQGMLFGNVKLIDSTKGSPIVLPLTNPSVQSIEVNVRPGCSSDYEDVAFAHMTDGSIYEDYATFSSKIKRLRTDSGDGDAAPVVPPRRKPINIVPPTQARQHDKKLPVVPEERPLPSPSPSPEKQDKKHKKDKKQKKKKPDKKTDGVPSEPTPVLPPRQVRPDTHRGMPLPPTPDEVAHHKKPEYMNHPKTKRSPNNAPHGQSPHGVDDLLKAPESKQEKESPYLEMQGKKTSGLSGYEKIIWDPTKNDLSDYETIEPYVRGNQNDLNQYEEIGMKSADTSEKTNSRKIKPQNVVSHVSEAQQNITVSTTDVASPPKPPGHKPFLELNQDELVERLKLCGLSDIAEECEKDKTIDVAFFKGMESNLVTQTFNLSGIKLAKFLQMRDSNWVPMT